MDRMWRRPGTGTHLLKHQVTAGWDGRTGYRAASKLQKFTLDVLNVFVVMSDYSKFNFRPEVLIFGIFTLHLFFT